MKILITGANGFLGYYLSAKLLQKGFDIIATGKVGCRLPFISKKGFEYVSMDFTNPFAVHDVFSKYKPEIIVHAGAMTNVDKCELNQWEAFHNNVEGTLTLLLNAAEHKSSFIFISTDFIFEGDKGSYREEDPVAAVNFYGRTKSEAEDAIKEYEYKWAIVRTSLVYGHPFSEKGNILTVVKEKLEMGEKYNVVDDQIRSPTYVEDLATGIVAIIETSASGIFHLAGSDVMTPYEMACKTADYLQLDKSLIKKVTAADFSQIALRPLNTSLIIEKAMSQLDYKPLSFEVGLKLTFPFQKS